MPIEKCPIWGTRFEAKGHVLDRTMTVRVDDSPRAGGGYSIDVVLVSSGINSLSDQEKARLTTWLVDQRALGNTQPEITETDIDYVKARRPLPVHERAERLLKFIALNSIAIGQYLDLFPFSVDGRVPRNAYGEASYPPFPTNPTCLQAMAWSESTTTEEVEFRLAYLSQRDWSQRKFPTSPEIQATVDGYTRIAEQDTAIDPTQAFVTMWFDESLNRSF